MTKPTIRAGIGALALATGITTTIHAASVVETFGSGANAFSVEFVDIGNPGNANDSGAGGGQYSSPYGGVPYAYRMGVTEVPQTWIDVATTLGMSNVTAGRWTGNQPAANISWYEAAAFVNFLNTSKGHQSAYNLVFDQGWTMNLWTSAQAWQIGGENLFRHKDACYFLPSEHEWYKSAFHQNDGVTANYWDYATGSNSIPTRVTSGTTAGTAVYNDSGAIAATVDNNGGLSSYGTRGQNGNVREWQESAGIAPNDDGSESRAVRGGAYLNGEILLRSEHRFLNSPANFAAFEGFRVASIPEPATAMLLVASGVILLLRKRGRCRRFVRCE